MPRRRVHTPLRVLLNNRLVGHLDKERSGAILFQYAPTWLAWPHALPVSLSLPLREDAYRGAPVHAVFDNLLPDADALRRRVAERVGAEGADVYSLLAAIGRDCVGALQFVPDDQDLGDSTAIEAEPVDDQDIEKLLLGLQQSPLGLHADDAFRISVAGAQEKTALLRHHGRWWKPHGTTPTTHILKKQIGQLPNGIDLSNSVENEYYCLKLANAIGLPVNDVEMHSFGTERALVVTRFDREWASDGRLLRRPQEDCCQALSVPAARKYQSHGGPGLVQLLQLLAGADAPLEDQLTVMTAQILFWLIGATDGHAKNFSIFLHQSGFSLTPLYDVLSVEPSAVAGHVQPKDIRLAMSVAKHYRVREIQGRHFVRTWQDAGLRGSLLRARIDEVTARLEAACSAVEAALPSDFPPLIHESVSTAALTRVRALQTLE